MTCVFCIAALAPGERPITADYFETELSGLAVGPLRLVADTESVLKVEGDIAADGQEIPVAVTLYREFRRVRIQLLSHSLSRRAIEQAENQLADALGAQILTRSDAQSEAKIRQAHAELEDQKRSRGRARPQTAGP